MNFELIFRRNQGVKTLTPKLALCQVIIEKAPDSNIGNLDKNKFLVPQDITMSQLMYIIRKRIKLVEDKALFLSVNHTVPSTSITVGEVFDQHQDEDGFLYLTFRGESTFGC